MHHSTGWSSTSSRHYLWVHFPFSHTVCVVFSILPKQLTAFPRLSSAAFLCSPKRIAFPYPLQGTVNDIHEEEARSSAADESAELRRVRIAEASSNLRQFKAIAPGIDAQHEMTAYRPEECIVFLGELSRPLTCGPK